MSFGSYQDSIQIIEAMVKVEGDTTKIAALNKAISNLRSAFEREEKAFNEWYQAGHSGNVSPAELPFDSKQQWYDEKRLGGPGKAGLGSQGKA